MAKQMQLTVIVLVLLITTVEIIGGNRHNGVTKGGAMYTSLESPTPPLSLSESSLTAPSVAPHPAHSRFVLNHRGGGSSQSEVIAGTASP